jgi:hypothetical protein
VRGENELPPLFAAAKGRNGGKGDYAGGKTNNMAKIK